MYGRVRIMNKTKVIYICPITNTQCDGCTGDSDCGLERKPKIVPVRINSNLSYELSTKKSKSRRKIQRTLLTFSKFVIYTVIAYCILVILGLILWLL